jgi:folylpolyglutamate synthase
VTNTQYLRQPREFDRLNLIHVAGTKGKGSTSAFIASILKQYTAGQDAKLHKIGLYTSPHLRFVRERIQINGEPISETMFAKYFFEIWDRLENYPADKALDICPAPPAKPVYFRYLTLMAFHTYLCENVDTAVIECGIGGEYDSTNILVSPTVGAVTSLGIDHTAVLGETIEEIAWHKAGIFKPTTRTKTVYTVDSQPQAALNVLEDRAKAAEVSIEAVPRHPDIESGKIRLGLSADFQKTNASLAVAVAAAHLKTLGVVDVPSPITQDTLPAKFVRGLETTQWGGRCEVRKEGNNLIWHLDGGHTAESLRLAGQWFASCIAERRQHKKPQKRVLLFNQQTRDAAALARTLHKALKEALLPVAGSAHEIEEADSSKAPLFTHAIFSTNITFASGGSPPSSPSKPASKGRYKADLISMNTSSADVSALTVQKSLANVWSELDAGVETNVMGTIEEAIYAVRTLAKENDDAEVVVLVTGSLHLVGGVLEVLESIPPTAS